ncbi:uncharacterized protein BDW43DRAFT_233480 [Aspergillus alliaceus]|uniref:uncharacterized protein n=1 Tax=Petromyces alliaceus TaxID=209559 RepID=UPI0012A60450|nr:uncharacterized protein BDW43DRAFT_233480 [Aspergillus alliaceus]KAB8227957.1 hypothetical protein BDW43DRAFT_233480 [Aspergillus alliaceus]
MTMTADFSPARLSWPARINLWKTGNWPRENRVELNFRKRQQGERGIKLRIFNSSPNPSADDADGSLNITGSIMDSRNIRRRRNPQACGTCRERRTKCDGQRPKCSFCRERAKDCSYPELLGNPTTPLEQELSRIRDQIDQIIAAVEAAVPRQGGSPQRQFPGDHGETLDMVRGFPFMTIRNEVFMALLGLDRTFSCRVEQVERRRDAVASPTSQIPRLVIPHKHAFHLLNKFAEHIHAWYPVLHGDFPIEFAHAITNGFPTSSESCLALLVLAIGSLFADGAFSHRLDKSDENSYIKAALGMLPCIVTDGDGIRAMQCLLLFSIYFLCCVKPCQAHNFVSLASYHIQDSLSINCDWEKEQPSIVGNCYWVSLLIESEILVQLELENSGIWDLSPIAPMPTSRGIWELPFDLSAGQSPSCSTFTGDRDDTLTNEPLADLSYFVTEIAMRKMLRRCILSVREVSGGSFEYAPIVAAELDRQLEEWHNFLPERFQFLGKELEATSPGSPQVQFLSTQYHAFRASVYWPAVYQASSRGEVDDTLLPHCLQFFESYSAFIGSAACAVHSCRLNLWTLCTRYVQPRSTLISTQRRPI